MTVHCLTHFCIFVIFVVLSCVVIIFLHHDHLFIKIRKIICVLIILSIFTSICFIFHFHFFFFFPVNFQSSSWIFFYLWLFFHQSNWLSMYGSQYQKIKDTHYLLTSFNFAMIYWNRTKMWIKIVFKKARNSFKWKNSLSRKLTEIY